MTRNIPVSLSPLFKRLDTPRERRSVIGTVVKVYTSVFLISYCSLSSVKIFLKLSRPANVISPNPSQFAKDRPMEKKMGIIPKIKVPNTMGAINR